ncbi:hypothetical protein L0Y49_04455 [bacterium]|nr:hypothetical protein [bacterium]MCI0565684.1 hypothetical protein [bacterium]MCI0680406.1 hypothetical protein [bacterium]
MSEQRVPATRLVIFENIRGDRVPADFLCDPRGAQASERKPEGTQVIPLTQRIDVSGTVPQIEEKFFLTAGIAVPTEIRKGHQLFQIRFIFLNKDVDGDETSLNTGLLEEVVRPYLEQLSSQSYWAVREYCNPRYKEGERDGTFQSCLNLNSPESITATEWIKNDQGERIGDQPVTIVPTGRLVIEDGQYRIIPA